MGKAEEKGRGIAWIQNLGKTHPCAEGRASGRFVALEKAVGDWDGLIAVLRSRHALRISSEAHIYEFLLCYNCHQLYIYKDGKELSVQRGFA